MELNIKERYADLKSLYNTHIREKVISIIEKAKSDIKERNRILILLFASIFILDYLMFCYHIDKNIFDIFPSIPALGEKRSVNIYLPALDGASILKEKRSSPVFNCDEKYAKFLFKLVVKGSVYKNTAMTVPLDLFVRKIWIYGDSAGRSKYCVFDIEPAVMKDNLSVINGSEKLFKEALDKTIAENISSIKKIYLLEKGIPGKRLWEN